MGHYERVFLRFCIYFTNQTTTFGLGWCIPWLECVGDIAFGTHRLGQKCVLFGRRKKARTHTLMHIYQNNYLCTSRVAFHAYAHVRLNFGLLWTWHSVGMIWRPSGFRSFPHKKPAHCCHSITVLMDGCVYAYICRGTHCRLQQRLTKLRTFQVEHVYTIIHYIYAMQPNYQWLACLFRSAVVNTLKSNPDCKMCMQTGGSPQHKLHWHPLLWTLL